MDKLLKIANAYGNVDVRQCLPKSYVHVAGERLQPLCRQLGIAFAQALVGFNERGRRGKYGYSPIFDGVVVSARSAPKLLQAIKERNERAAKRKPRTPEQRAVARRQKEERESQRFLAVIKNIFPNMPDTEAVSVAQHACVTSSGRVGRTRMVALHEAVELAVRAHVRHEHTDYDAILNEQMPLAFDREAREEIKREARDLVRAEVDRILDQWRTTTKEGGKDHGQ